MTSEAYDVVIVGGGIAGCTLASALATFAMPGFRIALVELNPFPADEHDHAARGVGDFDARVSALTHASCEHYQGTGVWAGVESRRCCPYRAMRVWDARGSAHIAFYAGDTGADELGCLVENRVLLAALLDKLRKQRDVTLLDGVSVQDAVCGRHGATVILDDGSELQAALLVAADGANSPLRDAMQIPVRRWDYHQDAIVCTVQTEKPHEHTAWQVFTSEGPLALLPLPGQIASQADAPALCSIVWSQNRERASQIMAMDDEDFCAALGEAFEYRLGRISAASRRFSFPLRQQHAVDYVREGFALLADAAHSLHPLAGQGLNLGIADAVMLAMQIRQSVAAGRAASDMAGLKRYQRQRKTDNLAMLAAVEGFHRVYHREAPQVFRWLRNEAMRGVDGQEWLKQRILRYAMGIPNAG